MRQRVLLARSTFALFVTLVLLLPATALGQTTDAKVTTTFRTPWGDPDLQGIWDTDAMRSVPLERPTEYGERATLTKEELAERAATEDVRARDDKVGRPDDKQQPLRTPAHWDEYSDEPSTQTSFIVDPPDGKIPALTAAETSRVAAHQSSGGRPVRTRAGGIGTDRAEDRGLAERCIVGFSTGPPMLPAGYNNNVQILQAPGYVALVVEMIHDVRIIPLGGPGHVAPDVRQWLGDSRGHWEGNTLVVDTTNFTDRIGSFSTTGQSWGTGADLRLTERFTRVDADTLAYEFTVENPSVFTRTFSARFPMTRSDLPLYEYACHEGNYGLYNILNGARSEERAAATP